MFRNSVKIKDVKLEIAQLSKSCRKRQKISQQELAEKLDVSRITIQNLESGKNCTIDTLLKLLQYFELLAELNTFFVERRNDNENLNSLY